MRAFLTPLAALVLLAASLGADGVRLRSKSNGNIIEVEVVEVAADKLAFRLVGGERLYTIAWETLDLDWIQGNSPRLWNELQLVRRPPEPEKPKEDPEADPFAKETPPADTKAILRNLESSLADRSKGIDPGRIEVFCRHEAKIDEDLFWRVYEEMRREGAPASSGKAETAKESAVRTKERSKDRQDWARNPAHRQKEEALREPYNRGQGGVMLVTYLRALSEGGFKGRVAWHLLRFVPGEQEELLIRLRKYEAQADDLSTRAPTSDGRRDALVLRKQLADLVAVLGRVSRESSVQEDRLKAESAALLSKLGR